MIPVLYERSEAMTDLMPDTRASRPAAQPLIPEGPPVLRRPPAHCPECATPLRRAFPACPACGEPLTPDALKARAEAAAGQALGLPERPAWPDLAVVRGR